jgi:TATA-binding protein-associated factor Taf7
MLRIVDRKGGKVVQKVTDQNGNFIRYQTANEVRPSSETTVFFQHLGDARRFIGIATPVFRTKNRRFKNRSSKIKLVEIETRV